MNPGIAATYNFAALIILVDGHALGGFDDDGTVTVEYASEQLESSVGADGKVTYSVMNDPRATVTFALKETSASVPILQAIADTQRTLTRARARLPLVALSIEDPLTGDFLSGGAVLLADPAIAKGKSAGSREFKFEIPYARNSLKRLGAFNA